MRWSGFSNQKNETHRKQPIVCTAIIPSKAQNSWFFRAKTYTAHTWSLVLHTCAFPPDPCIIVSSWTHPTFFRRKTNHSSFTANCKKCRLVYHSVCRMAIRILPRVLVLNFQHQSFPSHRFSITASLKLDFNHPIGKTAATLFCFVRLFKWGRMEIRTTYEKTLYSSLRKGGQHSAIKMKWKFDSLRVLLQGWGENQIVAYSIL